MRLRAIWRVCRVSLLRLFLILPREKMTERRRLRIRKIGERSLLPTHVWVDKSGSESALVAFSVVVRIDLRYLEVVHMYRRLSIFAELSRKAKKREKERAREKDGKTVSLISIIENRIKEWLAKRSLMIEGAEICLQISRTL